MSAPPTDEELRKWLATQEEYAPPVTHRVTKALLAELAALRLALAHERSQPSTGDREARRRYRAALEALHEVAQVKCSECESPAEVEGAEGDNGGEPRCRICMTPGWAWSALPQAAALGLARDLLAADVTGFDKNGREERKGGEELPECVRKVLAMSEPVFNAWLQRDTISAQAPDVFTHIDQRTALYLIDIARWLRTTRLGGQRAEWVRTVEQLPPMRTWVLGYWGPHPSPLADDSLHAAFGSVRLNEEGWTLDGAEEATEPHFWQPVPGPLQKPPLTACNCAAPSAGPHADACPARRVESMLCEVCHTAWGRVVGDTRTCPTCAEADE